MTAPLRMLVVCTANICRSPAAEHYLRAHAAERSLSLEVSSAGFLYDDEPASEMMAKVMGERGFDLSTHRARIADAAMLADVDVVVTMERRHGRDLAAIAGPRGIFTLRGLVAELAALDEEFDSPLDRLAAVEAARLPGQLLGDGSDEIADPFGKSARVNRRTADELRDRTNELLDLLFSETCL